MREAGKCLRCNEMHAYMIGAECMLECMRLESV